MKKLKDIVALVSMVMAPLVVAPSAAIAGSAHEFEFTSIDGKPMRFADWRGKVLLVVNTASFCGFTKQYEGLQKLWADNEAKGLVVVGVPSNDFGGQEPRTEGEIKKFCEGAFGVTFPLTEKYAVIGDGAHPFYKWAAAAAGKDGAPAWNFHKYLIGRDGRLVASFSSRVTPSSSELTEKIEKALAEGAATN